MSRNNRASCSFESDDNQNIDFLSELSEDEGEEKVTSSGETECVFDIC